MKTMMKKLLHMLCWEETVTDPDSELHIDLDTLYRIEYSSTYCSLSLM